MNIDEIKAIYIEKTNNHFNQTFFLPFMQQLTILYNTVFTMFLDTWLPGHMWIFLHSMLILQLECPHIV